MKALGVPRVYLLRARRMLVESVLALLIAIALPGAGALNTAYTFIWGAILFGGGMAVLLTVASLAVLLWRRRRGDRRPVRVFVDNDDRSWWWPWTALSVAVLTLAYLVGGAQFMAGIAGYGPGTVLAGLVTLLVLRRLQPN
jgi:hypothetical protein